MSRHIFYPDELYHYGIKGMKWGIRKDRDLSDSDRRKLHDSKPKKPDVEGINYHRNSLKGPSSKVLSEEQVQDLAVQMWQGKVTSFVERHNGTITNSKTKKGVVIRDKDGNRITDADFDRAQKYVWNHSKMMNMGYGSYAKTGVMYF